MLVFRFANRFIEPVLKSAHVDEIQITVAETLGVEGRSRYYDGIGALRDMVQNHLIQMMTFATIEPPALWDAEMIRDHKVEVLKSVHRVDPETDAVRGQYTAGLVEGEPVIGYRAEPGVDPTSRTETFAAVQLHVDTWRWEGIPVVAAFGQAARGQGARGRVPVPRAADPAVPPHAARARRTELAGVPHEPVGVHRAGRAHQAAGPRARGARVGAARRLRRTPTTARRSAYESLLLDVLEGDHTPFLRFDEVEWSWRIVDPILKAWKPGAPEDYVAGSDGPAGQHRFLGPGHYWRPLQTPSA